MIPSLFSNAYGDSFGLDILGYEFAGDGNDDWLMVGIRACAAGRCWDARFPCLLWDEAIELAAWLEESARGEPERTEIGFTEPNLRFEYLSREGDRVWLRVLFCAEYQPPWQPYEPHQRCDPELDFECTLGELRSFANLVRERLAQYPRRPLARIDFPDAAEPSSDAGETVPADGIVETPNWASDSRGLPDIDWLEEAGSTDVPDFPDLDICVGQTCGRLSTQSDAILVGGRVFQEREMRPWTCSGYSVRDPCVMLGIAEGVPGLPRPNAVAKFLLRAVAEFDRCDAEPPHPLDEEVLRAAHRMLCEEADLRRLAGGAARVALAEVRADRVVTVSTAPAGILLVDRRSGEVTPLANQEATSTEDAPTRGAIVADPEAIGFFVCRTEVSLTYHHAVVLCSDGVASLVSEREIGEIVKGTVHRDDVAEAMLDLVERSSTPDNASVVICDFSRPVG